MTTPQVRQKIDSYGKTVVNVIEGLGYKSGYGSILHSVSTYLEICDTKIESIILVDLNTLDFRSSFELPPHKGKDCELLSLLNDLNGSISGKIYL